MLVKLLEAACTNTGRATFYNEKDEQLQKLLELHLSCLVSERQRYGVMALLPINEFNKLRILYSLLNSGSGCTKHDYEWQLILLILKQIRISRLLKFMTTEVLSGERRINCARVRHVCQQLWRQADEYQLIKYAAKFKKIAYAAHLQPASFLPPKQEIMKWMFGVIKKSEDVQFSEWLRYRLKAKEGDQASLLKLPYDVAGGIAQSLGLNLKEIREQQGRSGKTSKQERMRAAKTGAALDIDFRKYDLVELVQAAHQMPERWGEIAPALDFVADKLAKGISLPARTAVVLDTSRSMIGRADQNGKPMHFAEAMARIFIAAGCNVYFSSSSEASHNSRPVQASGATDLRMALADAIVHVAEGQGSKAVILISDGYENQSSGSVSAIINSPAVKRSAIKFFHVNPVAAAEAKSGRSLSDSFIPLTVAALDQLPVATFMALAKNDPEILANYLDSISQLILDGKPAEAVALAQGGQPESTQKTLQLVEA